MEHEHTSTVLLVVVGNSWPPGMWCLELKGWAWGWCRGWCCARQRFWFCATAARFGAYRCSSSSPSAGCASADPRSSAGPPCAAAHPPPSQDPLPQPMLARSPSCSSLRALPSLLQKPQRRSSVCHSILPFDTLSFKISFLFVCQQQRFWISSCGWLDQS